MKVTWRAPSCWFCPVRLHAAAGSGGGCQALALCLDGRSFSPGNTECRIPQIRNSSKVEQALTAKGRALRHGSSLVFVLLRSSILATSRGLQADRLAVVGLKGEAGRGDCGRILGNERGPGCCCRAPGGGEMDLHQTGKVIRPLELGEEPAAIRVIEVGFRRVRRSHEHYPGGGVDPADLAGKPSGRALRLGSCKEGPEEAAADKGASNLISSRHVRGEAMLPGEGEDLPVLKADAEEHEDVISLDDVRISSLTLRGRDDLEPGAVLPPGNEIAAFR